MNIIILLIMAFVLIYASIQDYKTRLVLPAFVIIIFLCAAALLCIKIFIQKADIFYAFFDFFAGAVVGGGFLFIMALIGKLLLKKETLGGGDIKLMLAVGAALGPQRAVISLIFAFILACIFGLALILLKKISLKSYMPFVPFICIGVLTAMFLPNKIIDIIMLYII